MNLTGKLCLWVNCIIFLVLMTCISEAAFSQTMGILNLPGEEEDGTGTDPEDQRCDVISFYEESTSFSGVKLFIGPGDQTCNYQYYYVLKDGVRIKELYPESGNSTITFWVYENGTYQAIGFPDGGGEAIYSREEVIECITSKPVFEENLSQEVCTGESFELKLKERDPDATYKLYRKGTANSIKTLGTSTLSFGNFSDPGEYTVQVSKPSLTKCSDEILESDPLIIEQVELTIEVSGPEEWCAGSRARFEAVASLPNSSLTWYNSDGRSLGTSNSRNIMIEPGENIITVEARNGETGCSASYSFTVFGNQNTITPKTPYFKLIGKTEFELYINNVDADGIEYYWQDTPNRTERTNFPTPRAGDSGETYYVRAVDENGCWGPAVSISIPDFSTPEYDEDLSQSGINYIKTFTYLREGIAANADEAADTHLNTTYFDGLGREIQTVVRQGSPDQKDMVSATHHDPLGRITREFLPYTTVTSNGNVSPQPFKAQENFYKNTEKVVSDPIPFSMSILEPSPLNRVVEQGAPGAVWQPGTGHTIKFAYQFNKESDQVIAWNYEYGNNAFGQVRAAGYYQDGMLYKKRTVDEEGNEVVEYQDKLGRIVLKDVRDEKDEPHQTYYVYDDFGNLRMVLPPAFLDAWQKADGIVEESITYDGYSVVNGTKTITNTLENTRYFISSGGMLILGQGFTSGPRFHATTGEVPQPIATDLLKQYAFYYHYDERQRMVEKHVPGGGITYMVYDFWDRLVLVQDEEQADQNEWLYTKYDGINRPVITGLSTDSRNRAELQQAINEWTGEQPGDEKRMERRDDSKFHGYTTDNTFPAVVDSQKILTVSYYDDYNFKFFAEDPEKLYAYKQPVINNVGLDAEFDESENNRVNGLLTGSRTKMLGQDAWLNTVSYYDHKYRLIQSISDNHLGGIDKLSKAYDFTGKIMHSLHLHTGGMGLSILKEFGYDYSGRLVNSWQTIVESADEDNLSFPEEDKVLLAHHENNALGELVDKKLHAENGEPFKQSVDYRYNIRGWLKSINNSSLVQDSRNRDEEVSHADLFGMELGYTEDFGLGAPKVNHNGNITAIKWSAYLGLDSDENQRANTYRYDGLNRIRGADFHKKGSQWTAQNAYALGGLEYDKNGNIQKLSRKGANGSLMDELVYEYEAGGNRLMSVTDHEDVEAGFKDGNTNGDDYSYYLNGNLKEDKNKGIDRITYNHLNLPEEVVFEGEKGSIRYTYDAAGIKLGQLVSKPDEEDKRTDYVAGMVFENDALQFIQHEEGRVVYDEREEDPFEYQYHLKDHLGNVRLSFTSRERVDEYLATMESINAEKEEEEYGFLDFAQPGKADVRVPVHALLDHTHLQGLETDETPKAVRLNAAHNIYRGPRKTLQVMPGDKVTMSVYVKYLDMRQSDFNPELLMMALLDPIGFTISVENGIYTVTETATGQQAMLTASNDRGDLPPAGLSYYLHDYNMDPLDAGFIHVSTAAAVDPENMDKQHELLTYTLEITRPGFLNMELEIAREIQVSVGAENYTENIEIYFDDFTIIHERSPVVQADDYYPFGLTFNSYVRGDENKYKFQGQEHQDELGLGWISFKWRNHDPAIGRFFNVDPIAEDYYYNSPYAFAENKVISFIELEGLEAYPGGEILMIRRQMEQSGASKQELAEYDRGVSDASSVAVGFSPAGPVQDAVDLGVAIGEGDGPGIVIGVIGFLPGGDLLKGGRKAGKALDNAGDAKKLLPENAGPVGQISPSEVMNKTPDQIDVRAGELGLQRKGPDPKNGRGAYVDPQTGEQRILSHPNGKNKGKPDPHGHVNNPSGDRIDKHGNIVPNKEAPDAHLPIKIK